MARQQPSGPELTQVQGDFETFFLPFDASLDLGSRTTYGTTDPDVDLSMVNIRHLNNTRGFRGTWVGSPEDGNDVNGNALTVPYQTGQVVVGDNNVIYQRTAMNPTMNPNPNTNTAEWQPLGTQLNVNRMVDTTTTGGPGLIDTSTTPGIVNLQFRGYTMGNGVSISNTGEISVTNFSLTDVHVFMTSSERNTGDDDDGNAITWHTGDIAIVTTGTDRGTYVFTGANNTLRTTANADWTLLELPGNVVNMIGTRTGNVTIAQVVGDINNSSSQILTDTEYTANAYKYTGSGNPTDNPPTTAPRTLANGDLYIDTATTANTLYYYSNNAWHQASAAELDDIGDVYVGSDPAITGSITLQENDHLVYSPDAGGTGVAGWHNRRPETISAANIDLDDLRDVNSTPSANAFIQRNAATPSEPNGSAWIYRSPNEVAGQFDLANFSDVEGGAIAGQILQYDGTNWYPVTPSSVNEHFTVNHLDNIGDVATYPNVDGDYIVQAVQGREAGSLVSAQISAGDPRVVQFNIGAPFIDNRAGFSAAFIVPNANVATDPAGRGEISSATFGNLVPGTTRLGPFAITVGNNDPLRGFVTLATDQDAVNLVNAINNIGMTTPTGFAVITKIPGVNVPADNSLIYWNSSASRWEYQTLADRAEATLELGNLMDVMDESMTEPAENDILIRVGTNWVYRSAAEIADQSTGGISLHNLNNVNDTAPTTMDSDDALVWTGTEWVPRAAHRLTIRRQNYFPLAAAGNNIEIPNLTRTVVAERAGDIIAPVATRAGTAGNYSYTIRADSTDGGSAVQVQPGDLYVAGNRDLYYGSLDASDNLIFREILHPASSEGRTIRLNQLPNPTDRTQRQFIRWNPLADNNNGAWEITDEDETSLTTIFDIGDVDRAILAANPQYSFPDTNVISGSRTNAAVLRGIDIDVTFTTTSTGLDTIQPGDRIAFWNEVGPTDPGTRRFLDNAGAGFVVQTINHESPIMMRIHSPDNSALSETTAMSIGGQLRVVTATVTGTTGMEAPLLNGDILQYNAGEGHWENTPIGLSGAITAINAGDIGADGESTNTATQMVNVVGGEAYIEDVTVDRSGVMNPSDKQKLDDFPSRPTTPNGEAPSAMNPVIPVGQTDHYALSVEHTTGTGPDEYRETWVNISTLVGPGSGGNLVFTDAADTNSTQLTGYRQGETTRNVTRVITQGEILRLTLGVFEPMFPTGTLTRNWDQPANAIIANVDNPAGVDQYISSVRAVTLDSGNSQDLDDFTRAAFSNTPAADQDWTQTLTLTTGNILDDATGTTGGTTSATISYNQHDGTTETPYTVRTGTYNINWRSPTVSNISMSINNGNFIQFYQARNQVNVSQTFGNLSSDGTVSGTWTASDALTGIAISETINARSFNRSYTLQNELFKDNRTVPTSIASAPMVTRPTTVSTNGGTAVALNTSTTPTTALNETVGMPFVWLFSDTDPIPYGTGTNAILGNQWNAASGLTFNSANVNTVASLTNRAIQINPAAQTTFWLGVPMGTAIPTFRLAQPLPVTPTEGTPLTVTFNSSFTGAPAGWTDVHYTFYNFLVADGTGTITINPN